MLHSTRRLYVLALLSTLLMFAGCGSRGSSGHPPTGGPPGGPPGAPTGGPGPCGDSVDTAYPTSGVPPLIQGCRIVEFTGAGDGETKPFITSGSWVLTWSCDPTVGGAPAPFPLTITVATPDDPLIGPQPLDTTCTTDNMYGSVGVHVSGEQWLIVGTGGEGGSGH